MDETMGSLQVQLLDITEKLAEALGQEAQAKIKHLYDREELRAAEGNTTLRYIATGRLGKNEIERRAQLDSDCSAERNRMIESEAECIRITANVQALESSHRTLLTLLK
jgi:hypothetical protein